VKTEKLLFPPINPKTEFMPALKNQEIMVAGNRKGLYLWYILHHLQQENDSKWKHFN